MKKCLLALLILVIFIVENMIMILILMILSLLSYSQDSRDRKLANSYQYDAIVLFGGSLITPGLYYLNGNLKDPKIYDLFLILSLFNK